MIEVVHLEDSHQDHQGCDEELAEVGNCKPWHPSIPEYTPRVYKSIYSQCNWLCFQKPLNTSS